MLQSVECELCNKPIPQMSLYVEVKRNIPNLVTYAPEDVRPRGIHI